MLNPCVDGGPGERTLTEPAQILAALERVRPRLRLLMARYHIPREDAEDLAQDIAILVLTKGELPVQRPEGWLLGVASNLCCLYWRKKLRREVLPLDVIAEPVSPFEEEGWIRELDLDRALGLLPDRQRRALRMIVAGFASREAAASVGYSETGIRKWIARDLTRLAKHFAARAVVIS